MFVRLLLARLHPQKLHMVLDGRLRGSPTDGRPFSFFFTVTREDENNPANLRIIYADVAAEVTIKLPGFDDLSKSVTSVEQPLPKVPIMINTHKIKKHTMLVASRDGDLQKVYDAMAKKRAAELKKEHESAKDKKKAKKETDVD